MESGISWGVLDRIENVSHVCEDERMAVAVGLVQLVEAVYRVS